MNLNTLAKTITQKEGGKVALGIGQVKEVMRITLTELALMPEEEARKVLRRYLPKAPTAKRVGGATMFYSAMRATKTTTVEGVTRASKALATAAREAARRAKR